MITKNIKMPIARKRLLIVAVIAVVLVLTFITLETTGVTHILSPFNNKNADQIKEDETNAKNKQDFLNSKTNTGNNTTTPPEPTSDDIVLTAHRETDGSVTILTELKNYSDGTCNLTVKNGGDNYTQTAAVLYQASFSTCEGFSIPSNAIPNGIWQISLAITSKGKVNHKTISLEVQ